MTARQRPTDAEVAAFELYKYIAYDQQRGRAKPQKRAFTPGRVYGIFRGDVLVKWGVGRNAKQWADRAAGNCWNDELRAQYLGTL